MKESVLGRLGLAAAVAYLEDSTSGGEQLVVSLDTDGARRWLDLREGSERRADLLALRPGEDGWIVEAIEVKARTEGGAWTGVPPESVQEAIHQVRQMEALLRKIFGLDEADPFTPSRKEILKRQVFLEALQQWEEFRLSDEARYRRRLDELNQVFAGDVAVTVLTRIFLVNPNQSSDVEPLQAVDSEGSVSVVLLGVPWLKRAFEEQQGGAVEIPIDLLDEIGLGTEAVVEVSKSEEPITSAVGAVETEPAESPDSPQPRLPRLRLALRRNSSPANSGMRSLLEVLRSEPSRNRKLWSVRPSCKSHSPCHLVRSCPQYRIRRVT